MTLTGPPYSDPPAASPAPHPSTAHRRGPGPEQRGHGSGDQPSRVDRAVGRVTIVRADRAGPLDPAWFADQVTRAVVPTTPADVHPAGAPPPLPRRVPPDRPMPSNVGEPLFWMLARRMQHRHRPAPAPHDGVCVECLTPYPCETRLSIDDTLTQPRPL